MKKVFLSLISSAIILSLSLAAFAQSVTNQGGSQSIDVKAKTVIAEEEASYSVDIVWDDMTFTYEKNVEWNPQNHTYTETNEGKWNKDTATVTVTNHSNVPVDVSITYNAEGDTGISGTITNGNATLAKGEVGNHSGADKLVSTLTISGVPSDIVTNEGIKIGSITVTIGK